jgi:hypothetical protein
MSDETGKEKKTRQIKIVRNYFAAKNNRKSISTKTEYHFVSLLD